MAIVITHKKTDNESDWTQADLDAQIALGNYAPGTLIADIVQPSDWNDTHDVSGVVESIVAGTNINVDASDPANPIISSTITQYTDSDAVSALTGQNISIFNNNAGYLSDAVLSVTGLNTDNTDPANPIIQISVDGTSITGSGTPGDPLVATSGGSGDVVGPSSATDNAIARFDGTTGKLIQNSGASIDDSGNLIANNFSGTSSGTNTGDQTTSGTAGNISVTNGSGNPVIDIDAAYVGQASITTLGTITTGAWNAGAVTSSGNIIAKGQLSNGSTANNSNFFALGTSSGQGIGTSTVAKIQLLSSSTVGNRVWMAGNTNTTLTANIPYANVIIGAAPVTEATSGTHPLLASLAVKAPVITGGSASVTDTATVYIEGAPSATATGGNYALLIDSGSVRIDDLAAGGLVKSNTSGVLSNATSGADYAPATSGTSILKGNGSGGFSSATAGVDYQAAGNYAAQSQVFDWNPFFLGSVSNGDYRIVINCSFAGTINEITTRSTAGTGTLTGKINTTALGGTANSVSTSEQTQTHSSSNTFSAGDDIVLTVSSASSLANMSVKIKYTRTLP